MSSAREGGRPAARGQRSENSSGTGRPGSGHAGGGRPAGQRSSAPRSGAGRGWAGDPQAGKSKPPRRPAAPKGPQRDVHVADGVRLQKVLATAGLGSRRACEDLIAAGRVEVDGVVVRELGVRVDPETAVIHVDGMRVQLDQSLVTIALNKPLGVVSTMHDPEGRPALTQFVATRPERLFHVGRLDADSEGLLLLTNDGELANRLSHPKYEVSKTYLVSVEGRVAGNVANKLLHGIELEDGPAKVDRYRVVDTTPQASMVEVVLHEGRHRIVRRMFEELGHPVTRLVRTRIGSIHLGNLRPGATRVLGRTELGTLMSEVGL
ncbi:pseudouridine synthase [Oerskovia rustica]|uniref:Pseudouridine synthase n=1 Tax=Oerskovia rustica TaxID=2762237 RepID=A0ABR8RUY9_9CELL|nr:pseudouridine synthase [Oerskovia rustica]MBD7951584.1 pseudouridine synthase [Oerskovia rustica]